MSNAISPQELGELARGTAGVELLDVRTPAEFREIHVEFARNVPLDQLDPQALLAQRGKADGRPLYFICRSGGRGKMACDKMLAAGFPGAVNVEGGTLACEAAGLPVVRGKKAISLERQVRITAGSLVLLGAVLGICIHWSWTILAGAVGAGLIFAGVTDTCGMGMLLARMPWNQAGTVSPSCGCAGEKGAN